MSLSIKNIEIVFLNDGSIDNSFQILKKFQKKYPKIVKVYTHSNLGVGRTRNKGIQVCTGEYLTFVDADDYIDCDFVSTLMSQIGDNDIIISGYKKVKKNGEIIYSFVLKKNSDYTKFRELIVPSKDKVQKEDSMTNNEKTLRNHDIVYLLTKIADEAFKEKSFDFNNPKNIQYFYMKT